MTDVPPGRQGEVFEDICFGYVKCVGMDPALRMEATEGLRDEVLSIGGRRENKDQRADLDTAQCREWQHAQHGFFG